MIEADLAVVGISELATPEGRSPRTGPDLGRIATIQLVNPRWVEATLADRFRVVSVAPGTLPSR